MFDFSELLFVIFPLITCKKKSVDRLLHLIILMGISQTSLKNHSLLLISNMFLKHNLGKMFWSFGLSSSKQMTITKMANEWTYVVQIVATVEALIHQCTPNPL